MKCPSCGAEIGTSNFCEYCGSQITAEMQKELEQLNKSGCPKCGSTNIAPISGLKKGASAYMFGIFAANTIKNDYQCKNCGHKFC